MYSWVSWSEKLHQVLPLSAEFGQKHIVLAVFLLAGGAATRKQLRGARLYLSSCFTVDRAWQHSTAPVAGSGSRRELIHISADRIQGEVGVMSSGQRQNWPTALNPYSFRLMLAS